MSARTVILDQIPDDIYGSMAGFHGLTIYHTRNWHAFLERTFGWRVSAVAGWAGESLAWIVPFVRKRRLGKTVNVCLPFSHSVGAAYREPPPRPDSALPVQNLEVHAEFDAPGFSGRSGYHITELDLGRFKGVDELHASLHDKSVRYMIRKAEKNGLTVRTEMDAPALDAFYRLMVETRHRQGAPLYPARFFRNLAECFAGTGYLRLYLAAKDERPVSGCLNFAFGDRAIYGYAGSTTDQALKGLGGGELALWAAIADAYRAGLGTFDFGTTPASLPDLRFYKEKWGGVSRQLVYSYNYPQHGPKRGGAAVGMVSGLLKSLPRPVFRSVSPYILRWVI